MKERWDELHSWLRGEVRTRRLTEDDCEWISHLKSRRGRGGEGKPVAQRKYNCQTRPKIDF